MAPVSLRWVGQVLCLKTAVHSPHCPLEVPPFSARLLTPRLWRCPGHTAGERNSECGRLSTVLRDIPKSCCAVWCLAWGLRHLSIEGEHS